MRPPLRLPDEILIELLSPALHVPDESFASSASPSPFSSYQESSAAILLVSKSWRRVGTPLLYETVILRSKAQASALARTLINNKRLGSYVEKVRIEGGYGKSIYEIFRRTPRVTDLWLPINMWPSDNVGGYLKGFRMLNLRRLVVWQDRDYQDLTIRKQLCDALSTAIRDYWKELKTVGITVDGLWRELLCAVGEGILTTKIESLDMTGDDLYWDSIPKSVLNIMKLPTLQTVRLTMGGETTVFEGPCLWVGEGEDSERERQELFEKIRHQPNVAAQHGRQSEVLAPSVNPQYQPLKDVSEQDRTAVWDCILHHAMEFTATPGQSAVRELQRYRCGLVLVNKEFYRIGLPILYEAPVVFSMSMMSKLATSPHRNFIKILLLDGFDYDPSNHNGVEDLIKGCTNLSIVSKSRIVYNYAADCFPELAESTSYWSYRSRLELDHTNIIFLAAHSTNTLCHLHLTIPLFGPDSIPEVLQALAAFNQLRSLIIGGALWLEKSKTPPVTLPYNALPLLENLAVGNPESLLSATLLKSLAHVKLPLISRLDLLNPTSDSAKGYLPFLQAHGEKLVALRAMPGGIPNLFSKLCPNVTHWALEKARNFDFSCLEAVPRINDIALTSIIISKHCEFTIKDFRRLLDTDLANLRWLREVIITTLTWPTHQREIDKSPWIPVVEAMVQRWNVRVTNGQRQSWKPRLK